MTLTLKFRTEHATLSKANENRISLLQRALL